MTWKTFKNLAFVFHTRDWKLRRIYWNCQEPLDIAKHTKVYSRVKLRRLNKVNHLIVFATQDRKSKNGRDWLMQKRYKKESATTEYQQSTNVASINGNEVNVTEVDSCKISKDF